MARDSYRPDVGSMGHWLCIEASVLRAISADARRRLHSLEDAAVDLLRREMDAIMASPTVEKLWIVDESNFLVNLHGFDPAATVFACLPLVTTIDERLAEPLSQLASLPLDMSIHTLFDRNDTRGLAAIVSSYDALLVALGQVAAGLVGAFYAIERTQTCVQMERRKRKSPLHHKFPSRSKRRSPSLLPRALSPVLCENVKIVFM